MGFRVLAGMVALTHLAFVGYVLIGGFLATRRPAMIAPHLVCVGWVLAGFITPVACPLTTVENALRREAGEPVLHDGFVDHYLTGVVYPEYLAGVVRVLALCVVAMSWYVAYHAWARKPWTAAADHRPR
jgi:hypothetical protein